MKQPCLRLVCATCGATYGEKPCVPEMDGLESHGLCPKHAAEAEAEFAAFCGTISQDLSERQVERDITEASFAAIPDVVGKAGCAEPQPRPIFIPAAAVACACGLSEVDLHVRYLPKHWRRDEHWQEINGIVLYREANVGDFVGELSTNEQPEAAAKLMVWLTAAAAPALLRPIYGHAPSPTLPSTAPLRSSEPWFRKGAFE